MKFARADANYLAARRELAQNHGPRELWDVVDHWPLYSGVSNLARYLSISDLVRGTLHVPGHVAEFGTWRGATLMLLAKLLKIFDPHGPKVVHCFDTFEGLGMFSSEDGIAASMPGQYAGSLEELQELIALYELWDDIDIHQGAIEETLPELMAKRPELMFSMVYCDTDLYESTAVILDQLASRVTPGGIMVFDEWNHEKFPGEGIAVNQFLGGLDHGFEVEAPLATRQPSLVLRKKS
ncbi:MAG: TylF/MycF/NovP-related O-methyltransferase [Acidimicrobiales bacterium]